MRVTVSFSISVVGERIKMLERQFTSMRGKLLSELTARSDMSPDTLVDSLTQLPVALRAEYHKFVSDHLDTLESADSIRKIFRHINLHFTFMDHGLMGHLIEEFGSRVTSFNETCQPTLSRCRAFSLKPLCSI